MEVHLSNLLALDQASHTSGWSFFQDGELKKYGKFTFDDSDMGERLYNIRNKVEELIDEYKIDEVVMEDIQLQTNVGNNVQTFKILAEVFGVIEELLSERDIPHEAVLAAVWKSNLGIRGKQRAEQKRNAQEYVIKNYNIKATQDESDAICIGSYKCSKIKNNIKLKDGGFDWSI